MEGFMLQGGREGVVVGCHSQRCLKNDVPSHMHNHTQATDA